MKNINMFTFRLCYDEENIWNLCENLATAYWLYILFGYRKTLSKALCARKHMNHIRCIED